jgi:hypothetical protein
MSYGHPIFGGTSMILFCGSTMSRLMISLFTSLPL